MSAVINLSDIVGSKGTIFGPVAPSGQISTPNVQSSANSGSDPLSTVQVAARIGDPVPIVFGRRVGDAGGVLVSPPATEARFSNDTGNNVTARYHLVMSEGQLGPIPVKDVFQQSCRVGTFTQAYNRRAGDWGPGNFIVAQSGFEDEVPDCPIYCGSGTGSYAGMTTASFTVTIPRPFSQWDRQVHAFVRGGIRVERLLEGDEGASNNVADLVLWMLQRSSRVPASLIDRAALIDAARFTNANGLWFNGQINQPSNLADWLSGNLGYFLLRESRRGGLKGIRPLLPANEDGTISTDPVSWVFTFTEDHVLPGSFEITYASRVDQLPFAVQVVWRQQPEDGLGLARTATIRYGGSALEGPFEQHDLSQFCTTEAHAFKAGTYILARRRYIDHQLSFAVHPNGLDIPLSPGDIVRVRLRRITSSGAPEVHDYLYEVDQVGRSMLGDIQLEMTHLPVDDAGRSLVALDVSRAAGNGLMLPTGRAPVSCDLNDFDDDTVPPDPGPWDEWVPEIEDPPIYDDGPWPPGVVDDGDGWGPGVEEFVDLTFDEPDWEPDWQWDPDNEVWVPDADSDWGSNPVTDEWEWIGDGPETGDPPSENLTGPPPDYTPTEPFDESGLPGGGAPGDEGYTAAVSFSTPLVSYPDVFYAILSSGFVGVTVDVTVSNPPVGSALQLQLTDGADNAFTVQIPEGETTKRVVMGGRGDSLTATTARTISITSWSGGGYEPAIDAETEAVTPAMDITATATYNVEPYVVTISLQTPGLWQWDGGASEWEWMSEGAIGDWEWVTANQRWEWSGSSTDWSWVPADQRWSFVGSVPSGWAWLLVAQRWQRTSGATDPGSRPSGPPASIPSPVPSEVPPSTGLYTVVAQATVDTPPIPNGANDLTIPLVDFSESESVSVGTLTVPAVSMTFGSWRWNPATTQWEYPGESVGWRWLPAETRWDYLLDADDWTWNQATGAWEGGTGISPDAPPSQNGSVQPPDAERWLYDSGTRTWSGTAQIVGGVAPVFDGFLSGNLTYHLPLS